MSAKRSSVSFQKNSSNIAKRPSTATTSLSGRTIQKNKSEVSSSLSSAHKRADTITSKGSNNGRALLSTQARGNNRNERPHSTRKKKKGKVTIQDTEENRQTVIDKFLESEMKIQEKNYPEITRTHSSDMHSHASPEEEIKQLKLRVNRSALIHNGGMFPPVQACITLMRENGSKSDGILRKQELEENVHYFHTPSLSTEELRPHSAPISCKKDYSNGNLHEKIQSFKKKFEAHMENKDGTTTTGLKETTQSRQCTSSWQHLPKHQLNSEKLQQRSECCHMLPRINSRGDKNRSMPNIPGYCLSLHKQNIPDSTEERKLVSLKAEEDRIMVSLMKNEHKPKDRNQRKKAEGRKAVRSKTAIARPRKKSSAFKRSRASSFPLIHIYSSGKTASTKYNTSFSKVYESSEDDFSKDSKCKVATLPSSGTLNKGVNEAWSMPIITQESPLKLDGKTSSTPDTESSSTMFSEDIFETSNAESDEWVENSKESENLAHRSTTPQSESSGVRKIRGGTGDKSKIKLYQRQPLPQISGTRSVLMPSNEDNDSTNRTPSESSATNRTPSESSEKPKKVRNKNKLAFIGTFSGTATVHRDQAAEKFGYDFHVLPTSSASSFPSLSSCRSSIENLESIHRPKSSMRHNKPSRIEVEDLEFPINRETRPRTAVGSSRSASTKQVAFEVSESEKHFKNGQSSSRDFISSPDGDKERPSSAYLSNVGPSSNVHHRPSSAHERVTFYPKMEPYKNQMQSNSKNLLINDTLSPSQYVPQSRYKTYSYPKYGHVKDTRGHTDALSMPSRGYVDHYSQLIVWKQERMIRNVRREIDRQYGKYIYFVHPSREFLMSIFNKSVIKNWSFAEVFHEVEDYWIKPILNWHRRLYIYSLVYPPNE